MATDYSNLRPMLAAKTPDDITQLRFPLYASPKLDGVRCLIRAGQPVSRTLKPIRNAHVKSVLSYVGLEGLDGELVVGSPTAPDVYRTTNSGVMSFSGIPEFRFFVFDYFLKAEENFHKRLKFLQDLVGTLNFKPEIVLHEHRKIGSPDELTEYEKEALSAGYEGIVVRALEAPYKHGRSTLREQGMVKIKRFMDAEATVVGAEELMHNDNEAMTNELGYTERSAHQENQVPMGMLGALIVETPEGVRFKIGTGFTATLRSELWHRKDSLVGQLVKYKYFDVGVKDKPRHPVFLGFRDREDT